jgi:hypothetical protein
MREVFVYYAGIYKVIIDPGEGSTSCECADHTRWVLDPLSEPRCEHSAEAWAAFHGR